MRRSAATCAGLAVSCRARLSSAAGRRGISALPLGRRRRTHARSSVTRGALEGRGEAAPAVAARLRPSAVSDRNWRPRHGVLQAAHRRSRLGHAGARVRPLARPAADALESHRARRARPHAEHASAHHGAGVDLDDGEPRPGRARRLRLPQPQGPLLRRLRVRELGAGEGAAPLGLAREGRPAHRRARRAADLPAVGGERRDGDLLPHALDPERVHLPAGAQGRGRAGDRGLRARRRGLPHRGQGGAPAACVRKDRQASPARQAPPPHAPLGFLHAGRDGRRPHPPRLLEPHGPGTPQVRGREPLRARDPRLLPPRGRRAGRAALPLPVRHARAGRLRPRRQEDGRRPLLQRVADAGGVPGTRGAAVEADAHRPGGDRLGEDQGVGRRRLLRTPLPEREGAGARGDDRRRRLRARAQ